MKITQLSIKNFKSVEELVIRDIEDVLILVGRNNAGKSVMLDAIRAVSGDYAISEADFETAEVKLKEAQTKITEAHKVQTDAIQGETRGDESEYSLLFAHAQDTLMTIYSEINIAKQLLKIFSAYEKRISALEK